MKIRDIKTLFRSGIKKQRFISRPAAYNGDSGLEALILIEEVDAPKVIAPEEKILRSRTRGTFGTSLRCAKNTFGYPPRLTPRASSSSCTLISRAETASTTRTIPSLRICILTSY